MSHFTGCCRSQENGRISKCSDIWCKREKRSWWLQHQQAHLLLPDASSTSWLETGLPLGSEPWPPYVLCSILFITKFSRVVTARSTSAPVTALVSKYGMLRRIWNKKKKKIADLRNDQHLKLLIALQSEISLCCKSFFYRSKIRENC